MAIFKVLTGFTWAISASLSMFNCIREARASMPSATAYGKQEHPCPKDDNVRVLLHAGSNEHPWPKDNNVHVRLHLSKESAFVSICSCAPDARIH